MQPSLRHTAGPEAGRLRPIMLVVVVMGRPSCTKGGKNPPYVPRPLPHSTSQPPYYYYYYYYYYYSQTHPYPPRNLFDHAFAIKSFVIVNPRGRLGLDACNIGAACCNLVIYPLHYTHYAGVSAHLPVDSTFLFRYRHLFCGLVLSDTSSPPLPSSTCAISSYSLEPRRAAYWARFRKCWCCG